MKKVAISTKKSEQRKRRVKANIHRGGITRPRLCVSKTNKHVFLQIIDDIKGVTLASVSDKEIKGKEKAKMEIASDLGKLIASKAQEKKINEIVFDRNKYTYHGIVKKIAEGAREGGLKF